MRRPRKQPGLDFPSERDLVRITIERARRASEKLNRTVGVLTRVIMKDNQIINDLQSGRRSVSLKSYQRLHDGFSRALRARDFDEFVELIRREAA